MAINKNRVIQGIAEKKKNTVSKQTTKTDTKTTTQSNNAYSNTVKLLKDKGVEGASGIMTEHEWRRRYGKNGGTYENYLAGEVAKYGVKVREATKTDNTPQNNTSKKSSDTNAGQEFRTTGERILGTKIDGLDVPNIEKLRSTKLPSPAQAIREFFGKDGNSTDEQPTTGQDEYNKYLDEYRVKYGLKQAEQEPKIPEPDLYFKSQDKPSWDIFNIQKTKDAVDDILKREQAKQQVINEFESKEEYKRKYSHLARMSEEERNRYKLEEEYYNNMGTPEAIRFTMRKYGLDPAKFDWNTLVEWAENNGFYLWFGEGNEKDIRSEFPNPKENELEMLRTFNAKKSSSEYAKQHPTLASVGTVITAPVRGIASAVNVVGDTIDVMSGKGINPYKESKIGTHTTNSIRRTVDKEYASKWFGGAEGSLGNYGSLLYNGLMSLGDMGTSAFVGGSIGKLASLNPVKAQNIANWTTSALLASESANNTIIDAKERGLSDAKALALGYATGATEILTEKVSLDAILGNPSGVIKGVLKGFIAEGSEEMTAETLNTITDMLIAGNDSNFAQSIRQYINKGYSLEEAMNKTISDNIYGVLSAGVVGGFTGSALGGISGKANKVNNSSVNVKSAFDNTNENIDVINPTFDKTSDTANISPMPINVGKATTIKNPYNGVKPIYENGKPQYDTIVMSDAHVESTRKIVENAVNKETGKIERSKIKQSFLELFDKLGGKKEIAVKGLSINGDDYIVTVNKSAIKKVISDTSLSVEKLSVLNNLDEVISNGEYLDSGSYVQKTDKKKATIRFDYFETPVRINGNDYILAFDVEVFPNTNNYRTHKIINKMDLISISDADAGTLPTANDMKSSPSINNIPQINGVVNNYDMQNSENDALENELNFARDNALGIEESENDTKKMKLAKRVMRALNERYGINFKIYSGSEDSFINGFYENGTVYINQNAEKPMLSVIGHEFLHGFKDIDAEGFSLLKSRTESDLSLKDYNRYKKDLLNDYKENGIDISKLSETELNDKILEEAMSDLMGEIINDPETIRKIALEDKNLAERIMAYLGEFIDKIRSLFSENDAEIQSLVHNYEQLKAVYQEVVAQSDGRFDGNISPNENSATYLSTSSKNLENESNSEYNEDTESDNIYFEVDPYIFLGNNVSQLKNVIMQKQAPYYANKERLPDVDYSYTSDCFVMWKNHAIGNYTLMTAIPIENNSELTTFLERSVENGDIPSTKGPREWFDSIRNRERSNTGNNDGAETTTSYGSNDRFSNEQSSSNTVGRTPGNTSNTEYNKIEDGDKPSSLNSSGVKLSVRKGSRAEKAQNAMAIYEESGNVADLPTRSWTREFYNASHNTEKMLENKIATAEWEKRYAKTDEQKSRLDKVLADLRRKQEDNVANVRISGELIGKIEGSIERNYNLADIIDDLKDVDKGLKIRSGNYRFNDFYRNFERVFGKHFDKIKPLIDDFDNALGNEARYRVEKLAEEHSYIVKELGIKKGSKESKAVQWIAEGERNPDVKNKDDVEALRKMGITNIKNLDPNIRVPYTEAMLRSEFGERAEAILRAERWYRKQYDEMINAINETQRRIYPNRPEKLLPKRKNYMRHFREVKTGFGGLIELLQSNNEIAPGLVSVSEHTSPKEKWASIKQRRADKATSEGAIEGFNEYIGQASYAIYVNPYIEKFRGLARDLAELKSAGSAIGTNPEINEDISDNFSSSSTIPENSSLSVGKGKGNQYRATWTVADGTLDSRDLRMFYDAVSDIQNKGSKNYQLSASGEYILDINNKLIYTDGDYDYPEISKVISFDSEYEDDTLYAKEEIYDAERTQSEIDKVLDFIESIEGEGFFTVRNFSDSSAYERKTGRGTRENGGRTFGETGKRGTLKNEDGDKPSFSMGKTSSQTQIRQTDNPDLNGFIEYLNDFANDLAGKTGGLDRAVIKSMGKSGRTTIKALQWFNNKTKANAVLANIASMSKQIMNIPNGVVYLQNPANILRGMANTCLGFLKNDTEIKNAYKKSDFLTTRYADKAFNKFDPASAQKFFATLLGSADEFGTRSIWNALYHEAVQYGESDPIRYADVNTRKAVAGRGIGELPLAYKSQLAKLALPFQIEPTNSWNVMRDLINGNTPKGKLPNYADKGIKTAVFLLMTWGMNAALEALTGGKGSFDPLGDIIEGIMQGWKEREDEKTPAKIGTGVKRAAQNVAGDFIGSRAFGWTVGALLDAVDEDWATNYFNDSLFPSQGVNVPAIQSATKMGKKFADKDYLGAAVEGVTSFAMPYGGKQLDKTIRGITDYARGGNYQSNIYKELSTGERGDMYYPIEDGAGKLVKSAIFGPSSLKANKDYWDDKRLEGYKKAEASDALKKERDEFIKAYKKAHPDSEVVRLYGDIKRKEIFPYEPIETSGSYTYKKVKKEYTLSDSQKQHYQKLQNELMQKKYNELFATTEYKNADDETKKALLAEARKEAKSEIKETIKTEHRYGRGVWR